MEVEKMISGNNNNNREDEEEDEDVPVVLPGFRFHPTDEELVGFYLRRKVEKKPMNISIHQLVKQIDIYNYDPWDLPKAAAAAAANGSNNNNNNVGEKGEWYFYCKRGRKYRNSIRPNRVTASGFWKATGIDRPIYSSDHCCKIIGLKKSLVYYRGTAGKGTKTDWMMHEFRLPPLDHDHLLKTTTAKRKFTNIIPPAQDQQEAEVWTLCRILKRSGSNKKCIPDWREVSSAAAGVKRRVNVSSTSSKTCTTSTSTSSTVEYSDHKYCQQQGYNNISFRADPPVLNIRHINEIKKKPQQQPFVDHFIMNNNNNEMMMMNGQMEISQLVSSSISDHERLAPSTTTTAAAEVLSYSSSFSSSDVSYDFLKHGGDWEDDDQLKSFVEFAADPILFV